jgi:hypothetical protein
MLFEVFPHFAVRRMLFEVVVTLMLLNTLVLLQPQVS